MQLLTARDDPHGTVGENSIEKTGNKTTNIPPFLQLVTTVTKNKLSFRKGNGEFFFSGWEKAVESSMDFQIRIKWKEGEISKGRFEEGMHELKRDT